MYKQSRFNASTDMLVARRWEHAFAAIDGGHLFMDLTLTRDQSLDPDRVRVPTPYVILRERNSAMDLRMVVA